VLNKSTKILTKEEEELRKDCYKKTRHFNRKNLFHIDCCSNCGSKENINLHHWDYTRPDSIIAVCYRCHVAIHNNQLDDRTLKKTEVCFKEYHEKLKDKEWLKLGTAFKNSIQKDLNRLKRERFTELMGTDYNIPEVEILRRSLEAFEKLGMREIPHFGPLRAFKKKRSAFKKEKKSSLQDAGSL